MALSIGGPDSDDDDTLVAAINTTPLVDIMLVLLIIFLITVPVVTHTVPVALPHEVNQPNKTRPENITIAVNKEGDLFWNDARVSDNGVLLDRLKGHANDDGKNKDAPVDARLYATLATEVALILKGAHIIRTHDVKAAADAARATDIILQAR